MMRTRSAMQGRFLLLALLCLLLCGGAAVYADVIHNGLTISGGTEGTDFAFNKEVLLDSGKKSSSNSTSEQGITILTSENLTISGTLTAGGEYTGIYIPTGVTANLTLDGASIGGGNHTCPITVEGTLYLTLTGSNVVDPHDWNDGTTVISTAGIWVLESGNLIITENSTGSLKIEANYGNAAIGQTSYAASSAFGKNYTGTEGTNKAGSITINGGILTLTSEGSKPGDSRSYNSGAAIGSAESGDFTSITINGGIIDAESYTGAAIGAGWRSTAFSAPKGGVTINGGTINATGGQGFTSDGVGGSTEAIDGGVTIKGGSVKNAANYNRPTDGTNDLYMATITLNGVTSATAITEVKYYLNGTEKSYSVSNVQTMDGKLYLWLPEGAVVSSVTAGGSSYTGNLLVQNDDSAAGTFITGTTYTVSLANSYSNVNVSLPYGNQFAAGATVYVQVDADEGYAVTGVGTMQNPDGYTLVDGNIYSFTMPAENVTVYATAQQVDLPDKLDLSYGDITFGYDTSLKCRYLTYYAASGGELQTVNYIPAGQTYTITQTNSSSASTANTIKVENWDNFSGDELPLKLTINNLNINADTGDEGSESLSENLIDIDNSTVELTLDGASTLTSNVTKAANREVALLGVDGTSELTITQASGSSGLTVTALAGYGASIGGDGKYSSSNLQACGTINIKGGKIESTNGDNSVGHGAAIGSGRWGTGGTVNISGGEVTATSYGIGAAIGSGGMGTDFTVNISGGTVTAENTYGQAGAGAAIGSGQYGNTTVTISGGAIEATGNSRAPAIGSGYGSSANATVSITGGNINIDNDTAATIGKCSSVTITGGSVNGTKFNSASITDGANEVYLITADLTDTVGDSKAVTGSITGGTYKFDGVKTNSEGKIFLWLPTGDASIVLGESKYVGAVTAGSTNTFTRLKNLSELTIELSGDFTYTGSQIRPEVTVKDGDSVVDSSKYTLTYGDNTNAGTGTVTVKAASSSTAYNGEATRLFTIVPVKLEVVSVTTKSNSREYNGSSAVEISGIELNGVLNSEDVSVSTESLLGDLPSANAGSYSSVTLPVLTLTGAGKANYTLSQPSGEVKLAQTFTITKAPAPKPSTVTVSRNYAVAKVSVPTGIVAGEGSTFSVGVASGSGADKVGDADFDAKGNLTFTLSGGAKDDEIVLPVSIHSPNYEGGITTNVTVALTDKLDQRPLRVKVSGDSSGGTLSLSSSGGSGKGTVSYEIVSGTESISVSGNVLTASGPGTAMVIATKEGTGQYNPARSSALVVTRTEDGKFIVDSNEDSNDAVDNSAAGSGPSASVMSSVVLPVDSSTWGYSTDKLNQRPLTVKASSTTVSSGGILELSASGGSGKGAVSYEVIKGTGSASVSGSTLTGEASGTVTVIATKAGTSQYNPARSQPLVITVE